MTKDTSDVVARLEMRRLAILGLATPTPRRKADAALITDALALISSLVAERDAGAESALRIAGKYADAADRVEALTTRALTAERLLAEARAGLERVMTADTRLIYRGMATVADRAEIGPAGEIAQSVLASIGGGNG